MGWFNAGTMNGLAEGITNAGAGIRDGLNQVQKNRQAQIEMALKQRLADLQAQQIGSSIDENRLKSAQSGMIKDASGNFIPNPDYLVNDPENPGQKLNYFQSQDVHKNYGTTEKMVLPSQMGFPKPQAGQIERPVPVSALQYMAAPPGPIDDALAVALSGRMSGQQLPQLSAKDINDLGRTAQGRAKLQDYSTIQNQARLGNQFEQNYNKDVNQFEVGKAIQVANATKDEVKNVKAMDLAIKRMGEVANQAQLFKPSGAEYKTLQAKALASSYDPRNLIPGASPYKLSQEEEQRLSWYQGLSTDAITSMFETGGKQLTPTEKAELGNLAITPNDTAESINAKLPRLLAKLENKKAQSQEVINQYGGYSGGLDGGNKKEQKPQPQNEAKKKFNNQDLRIERKKANDAIARGAPREDVSARFKNETGLDL